MMLELTKIVKRRSISYRVLCIQILSVVMYLILRKFQSGDMSQYEKTNYCANDCFSIFM